MNLLHHLPNEIIRECIMPYTYNPQCSELCEDIKDYHFIRSYLGLLYKIRYPDDSEDKEWLSNDINRFLNRDSATMFGIEEYYIDKIRRLCMLEQKSSESVIDFIVRLQSFYNISSEVNIKLAVLKPKERKELVDFIRQNTY